MATGEVVVVEITNFPISEPLRARDPRLLPSKYSGCPYICKIQFSRGFMMSQQFFSKRILLRILKVLVEGSDRPSSASN